LTVVKLLYGDIEFYIWHNYISFLDVFGWLASLIIGPIAYDHIKYILFFSELLIGDIE